MPRHDCAAPRPEPTRPDEAEKCRGTPNHAGRQGWHLDRRGVQRIRAAINLCVIRKILTVAIARYRVGPVDIDLFEVTQTVVVAVRIERIEIEVQLVEVRRTVSVAVRVEGISSAADFVAVWEPIRRRGSRGQCRVPPRRRRAGSRRPCPWRRQCRRHPCRIEGSGRRRLSSIPLTSLAIKGSLLGKTITRPSPEMCPARLGPWDLLPSERRLTIAVAPVWRSCTMTSSTKFASGTTRSSANAEMATKQPSPEIETPALVAEAWGSSRATLTREVIPATRSRTKMPATPLVSPATRLLALDSKATTWPLAETTAAELLPSPSLPSPATRAQGRGCVDRVQEDVPHPVAVVAYGLQSALISSLLDTMCLPARKMGL